MKVDSLTPLANAFIKNRLTRESAKPAWTIPAPSVISRQSAAWRLALQMRVKGEEGYDRLAADPVWQSAIRGEFHLQQKEPGK